MMAIVITKRRKNDFPDLPENLDSSIVIGVILLKSGFNARSLIELLPLSGAGAKIPAYRKALLQVVANNS